MKNLILTLCIGLIGLPALAQMGIGMPMTMGRGGVATTFNEKDMAIGINPANLGWDNIGVSVSALSGGVQVQSDQLNLSQLSRILFKRKENFTQADRDQLSGLFTGENGLNFQSNIRWAAISFQIPKVGGFAASLESYSTGHITLGEDAADIFFHGANAEVFQDSTNQNKQVSEVFDGTNLSYQSLRAFNINYGRKIMTLGGIGPMEGLEIYAGGGFRYIWGMGNLDITAEDGDFSATSAFSSNFTSIDYGTIQNFQVKQAENIFNAAGTGYSIDLGLSAILANKVKAGISFINIGEIEWNTNVLVAGDTTIKRPTNQSDGANDYQFAENAALFYGEDGVLNFKPGETFTTDLPAVMRIGFGVKVLPILEFGADLATPLNSADPSLDAAQLSVAGEVNLGIARISTGYALNRQYGESLPLGFQLNLGTTQLSLGTQDVMTFFKGDARPNASLAFGMLRFSL